MVYVPQGSLPKIITHLSQDVSNLSLLDRHAVRFLGAPQQGWISMPHTTQTKADFYYNLCTSKAALQTITLVPGETTYMFLHDMAKKLNLDSNVLMQYYRQKAPLSEGFFIPQTYAIPLGIKEKQFIDILHDFALKEHKRLYKKFYGTEFNMTRWKRIVIIASVIQKEAANNEEMPIVASVIYNRLKKGMRLQMDGTLNYDEYSHQKVTAKRIREDKSRYNTYKSRGIPFKAVCVVSPHALKAAVSPADTEYLYFMRNKNGVHDFTRYFSTHRKNIENVKK